MDGRHPYAGITRIRFCGSRAACPPLSPRHRAPRFGCLVTSLSRRGVMVKAAPPTPPLPLKGGGEGGGRGHTRASPSMGEDETNCAFEVERRQAKDISPCSQNDWLFKRRPREGDDVLIPEQVHRRSDLALQVCARAALEGGAVVPHDDIATLEVGNEITGSESGEGRSRFRFVKPRAQSHREMDSRGRWIRRIGTRIRPGCDPLPRWRRGHALTHRRAERENQ